MNGRGIACIGVLLAAVVIPLTASASQPPIWSEPVQIGSDLPSSWFPDINADAAGSVRLVWSSSLIEGDANQTDDLVGAVIISQLVDGEWTTPGDIYVMDGGIASRPMISSDGQYLHMIFRTGPPGEPVRLVYSRAALSSDLSSAHSWSTPYRLSVDESYWGQIAVAPGGALVVVFNEITEVVVDGVKDRRAAIVVRRSLDRGRTWSPEARIAETTERVARTSLSVAPNGQRLIVAWDEGYDNLTAKGEPTAVAVAASSDGGATWGDHQRFPGRFEQSVVATDGVTTLLVYRSTDDDSLLYRTSDDLGVSWSDQSRVPGARARPYPGKHNFDKLSMAFDGDGRLLLAYVGTDPDAPNGLSVIVATCFRGDWTAPQAIAAPVGYPEYPRISVALGNRLQVAYFVRDREFEIGRYTMWVVAGRSDAREIAPLKIEPVPVPTAAPQSPPVIQISVAPTAPSAPQPLGGTGARLRTSPQETIMAPIHRVLAITAAAGVGTAGIVSLLTIARRIRL